MLVLLNERGELASLDAGDLALELSQRRVSGADVGRDLVFEVGRVPGEQIARRAEQALTAVETPLRVVGIELDEVLPVRLAGLDEVTPRVVRIRR